MHYLSITFANFDHQLVAETVASANTTLLESVSEYSLEKQNDSYTVIIDTPFALTEQDIKEVAMKLFELGLNDFELNATELKRHSVQHGFGSYDWSEFMAMLRGQVEKNKQTA